MTIGARFRSEFAVKVKDVLVGWPLDKWVAEDPAKGTLDRPAGELQLLWFTNPDPEGWFRLFATDPDGREWSTFCRVQHPDVWRPLERALASNLRTPLDAVGEIDLSRQRA